MHNSLYNKDIIPNPVHSKYKFWFPVLVMSAFHSAEHFPIFIVLVKKAHIVGWALRSTHKKTRTYMQV
jgi:hypothetical protein